MMRKVLQLATVALLIGTAGVRAQVSSPDKLIGHAPAAPPRQSVRPVDDLQWLWQYTKPAPGGRANDLRLDARFQALLKDGFAQPQSMWGPEGAHSPLSAVIPLFVSQYGAVYSEGNRYVTVDGCVPSFCAAEGLLWIDLGRKTPLAVFAAVNWTTEGKPVSDPGAEYNLWVFPNHNLAPNELPLALTEAVAHWDVRLAAAHRMVPHIVHAILVEPDGTPAALNPELVGANTIAPQPDTVTPAIPE